jgi:hypothetical protein
MAARARGVDRAVGTALTLDAARSGRVLCTRGMPVHAALARVRCARCGGQHDSRGQRGQAEVQQMRETAPVPCCLLHRSLLFGHRDGAMPSS